MIQIPTFQNLSANFRQEIELETKLIQLQITYNVRVDFFFLNFTGQDGSILYGIKMVPNWPLLFWHKGFIQFDGDLMIQKTDLEAGDEITYDNFGNGWNLFYLTPAEVTQWRIDNGL